MVTTKSVFYVVSYTWRNALSPGAGNVWKFANDVLKDEHPFDWLIDCQTNHRGKNKEFEYVLISWSEITEAQYRKWSDEIG